MAFRKATSYIVVVISLAVGPSIGAQTASQQALVINRIVSSYISDHHVPGMSVAVIDAGHVVLTQGFGLADVENNVPASADTVFRIASVSKSITATAAMKLVESKELDIDAPIQQYCPDFPKKPWEITTRELLTHQSGIRDYRNQEETVNTRHYSSIRETLTQFASDPLEFEPGTKMQYTSYGYITLGCVIEGASGTSYDRYMYKAIFEPALMPATRLDDVFAIIPRRARGYRVSDGGELQNSVFVDVSNKPPGSGINSSANDMGNFVTALYASKLVSRVTLDRMLTPAKTRDDTPTIYGFGFFRGGPLGKYRGLEEAGHGGDQQGVSSVLYLLPQRQFGVVILSNLEGQSSLELINLSRRIYDAVSSQ